MSDKNVLIQVKDLKKAFGTNQVLDGITTDICQGEVVAVIGPSGSGKSFHMHVIWTKTHRKELQTKLREAS